jgi:pyruvate/2-oxoglutarate dehydrogenase complex dihydrolipoamide acyltransferase (E2) component
LPNDPQELLKLCNALPEDKETTASNVICNDLRTALSTSTNPYPPAWVRSIDAAVPKHDKRDVRPEQLAPVVVQNIETKVREEISDQLYRIVQFLDAEDEPVTVNAKSESQPAAPQPAGDNPATPPTPAQPVQQASSTVPKDTAPPAAQQLAPEASILPLTPRDGLDGLESTIKAKVTGNIAHNGEHIENVVDSTLPIFGPGVFGPGGPFDGLSGGPLDIYH